MKTYLRLLSLLLLPLVMAAAAGAISVPPTAVEKNVKTEKLPRLRATFIQPLEVNRLWDRARWEGLFDSFQNIGLKQVVIQWTLHDNVAFYATRTFGPAPIPLLETLLELAEARGIELYLGLASESRYWEMIKQSPLQQEEYLTRLRWKSTRVAQEVASVAIGSSAFKGWYIPEEIDDFTWRQPQSRRLLYNHLKQLSGFLKELTPGRTVVLSGFSRGNMDPDSYGLFWNNLFKETSVDTLLFQDGIGSGNLPGDLLPLYLKAVRKAADTNGKKLQVVVELFSTVSEAPFKAVSAGIPAVKQQLQMADDYATDGVNSFSVPDYMSLEGGASAEKLLHDYKKYLEGGTVYLSR